MCIGLIHAVEENSIYYSYNKRSINMANHHKIENAEFSATISLAEELH